MLSFFKINDPYRVILVFLGLIGAWVIAIISHPLTTPELSWMIIGERLGNGNILYRDLWTETGPLASGVYWLIDSLFGRSQTAYLVLSLILVCIQSILFNRLLLKNGSLSQPVYVPALIYACLSILFFDFMTLSPQLMANTFLLLALDIVFEHITARMKQDEKIQYIGFFLSAATLFYFPYFVFLVGFLAVLLVFTGTVVRRYLLIIHGFLLPIILVGIYYWYRDGFRYFWDQFIMADFFQTGERFMTANSLFIIISLPLTFTIFSLLRFFGRTRYTNFQIMLIQVAILLLAFASLGYWLSPTKPPHALLITLPFTAFLISHFFMLVRGKLVSEVIFIVFLGLIILWNMGTCFNFSPTAKWIDISKLKVTPSKWENIASGKNVMLLSPDISVLQNSTLATPFLTWRISSQVFDNPSSYSHLILIYNFIKKENPDLILDPSGVMVEFFNSMPELKGSYKQTGEYWVRL